MLEEFRVDLEDQFFALPRGSCSDYDSYFLEHVEKWLEQAKWYEVYDLFEYVAAWNMHRPETSGFRIYRVHELVESMHTKVNAVLREENAPYRLCEGVVTPITNETELKEIATAAKDVGDRFQPARKHIKTALGFLADRRNPEYRNSVKESISAVESVLGVILRESPKGIESALSKLQNRGMLTLHGGLKAGLEKLYGYTSNADGIRHALMDESNLTRDEARYFLVICSAFVNYLIAKSSNS